MRSRFPGAPRLQAWAGLVLAALILAARPGAALAHEGHDHGPPAAAAAPAGPRVVVQSDAYELVGVLRGDRLVLYLDRFDTNEPVADAAIAVSVGGDEEVRAAPEAEGTYGLASPRLLGEGPLELVFAVTGPAGDDLLIGTLHLPARAAAASAPPSPLPAGPGLRIGSVEIGSYGLAGLALALGLGLGLALRGRAVPAPGSTLGQALVLVLGLALVLAAAPALAHEGHDHGAPEPAPAGDAPRRLPDGTLFVPKPSQRLLDIRTRVTRPEAARRTITLAARIIGDPNRSGLVQSINGGRIVAPEAGLPRLGQRVRRGEVLALVEQALPQADRTTISEKAGEIEQLIAVAETRLRRLRGLAEKGIAPASQIVDAETELEGLRRRREVVRQTRAEPEILRAPVDGTVSAARVVAGQVVAAQDMVFQIVDPDGLWVEALAYGEIDPGGMAGASAATADGTALTLAFRGAGRALQQQAAILHFAVENPPASLSLGQPVTVFAQSGAALTGILLPREAVVRGGNGEAVVWRHTAPERFEARPVRAEPFDAARVVVRAGLGEGERVVVRGADLINHVR